MFRDVGNKGEPRAGASLMYNEIRHEQTGFLCDLDMKLIGYLKVETIL